MTTVVISQPMYFPWPGFIAQLALADVVIWLDDTQFSRGSFTNRVQIRAGKTHSWLTVPLGKGSGRTKINDLTPSAPDYLDQHASQIEKAFEGTPGLDSVRACVDHVRGIEKLSDALIASSEVLAAAVGISWQDRHLSSALNIHSKGSQRIFDLVKAVGGTRYITGHGARNYLDHDAFDAAGVAVEYMDYAVLPWRPNDPDFTPYVTALDLLAHAGPLDAAKFLNPRTQPWNAFVE
ncbi:MAG: WbqC family protein [Roseobacter sp.]